MEVAASEYDTNDHHHHYHHHYGIASTTRHQQELVNRRESTAPHRQVHLLMLKKSSKSTLSHYYLLASVTISYLVVVMMTRFHDATPTTLYLAPPIYRSVSPLMVVNGRHTSPNLPVIQHQIPTRYLAQVNSGQVDPVGQHQDKPTTPTRLLGSIKMMQPIIKKAETVRNRRYTGGASTKRPNKAYLTAKRLTNLHQILSQQLAKIWLDRVGKSAGNDVSPARNHDRTFLAQLNSTLMMLNNLYQQQQNYHHRSFYPPESKSMSSDLDSILRHSHQGHSGNTRREMGVKIQKKSEPDRDREASNNTVLSSNSNMTIDNSNNNNSSDATTCDYTERNNRAINIPNNNNMMQQQPDQNQEKQSQDSQQQQAEPQVTPQVGEARQKRRLLRRIMKKADWNALLIEVSKVFLRYFLDLVLNDMANIGKSGSNRKHLDPKSTDVTDMLRDFLKAAAGL